MGTRATVKFYSKFDQEKPILSTYHQFDGYIDGVGHDLARFIESKKITNGFSSEQTMENGWANGMGCLAAQYVREQKTGIGGLYVDAYDSEQEYNYRVRETNNGIIIEVDGVFKGTAKQLLKFQE